ncbi:hypothetical protein FACS1894200_13800 [Spirochaetia bacterium]|nr:hypothetical protein FACS1894200_13800 [Spirochaetia bacterium]
MKTVDDYLNDSRITEDPDMQDVPYYIREVHAIRLKLQDEAQNMTPEELTEYKRKSNTFLVQHGIRTVSSAF